MINFPQYSVNAHSFNGAKGVLYKIKNGQNITISYLFGTIHAIPSKHFFSLDGKIFKKLKKCNTLFLELGVDRGIKVDQIPDSVEKLLIIRAKSVGQEIKGLETEASRFVASQAVKEEVEDLKIRKSFVAARAVWLADRWLETINDHSKIGFSAENRLSFLLKGYECLIEAIRYADWSGSSSETAKVIEQVADAYQAMLESCRPDLGTTIKSLIASKQSNKFRCEMWERGLLAMQLSWAKGNRECDTLFEKYDEYEGENDPKFKNCREKEMIIRDRFMLNNILNGLKKASKKQRNFYAIGIKHIIGNYENLKIKLEKSGYDLVNAYEKGLH